MVSIVGKYRWLMPFCFCVALYVNAVPVELKITSLDGAPLESAGVGVPFLVEVKTEGRDTTQKPHIAGLGTFQVQQAGMRVYSLNGQTTSSFTYKVRIDKAGSYVIGPAELYIDGVRAQSKAMRLTVADTQVIDQAYVKKVRANEQDILVQLSVDKTKAYVGERIKITLACIGRKDKVELSHMDEPVLSEFNKGAKSGPDIENITMNGVACFKVSWVWDIYAKKAGQCIIPAVGADYNVESEVTGSLALFSPFFRTRIERKRTYSNACAVQVQELPAYQGHVDAVGKFVKFDASINPSVAQEGEGMVLRFEVEGDGNLAQLTSLQLQHMPQALRWYDSKQYVRDTLGAQGLPVKCFEFIVQGLEQGTFEIPSQSFTYFDVELQQYVTLKSTSCTVTVKYNPAVAKRSSGKQQEDIARQVASEFKGEDTLQLNTWSSWRPVARHKPMPWWLFLIFAFVPLLLALVRCIQIILQSRAAVLRQHFAFKQARKKIKEAQRHDLVRNLHTIFIELFALRLQCAPSLISQEIIEAALRRVGMAEQEIHTWEVFYAHMYEYAFFTRDIAASDKDKLFEQAMQWVSTLEQVL